MLETFCNGAKAEVGLINSAQVYCYADTRLMKSFPQLLKVLYNSDCVSDQAIIYWHAKGAKPQGKQHFLKATEGLVKVSNVSRPQAQASGMDELTMITLVPRRTGFG